MNVCVGGKDSELTVSALRILSSCSSAFLCVGGRTGELLEMDVIEFPSGEKDGSIILYTTSEVCSWSKILVWPCGKH